MRIPLDDFLGTEIHGFFKDTACLRIEIIHGTSWLRLACASSRLSFPLSFFVHRLAQIITDFFNIYRYCDYHRLLSSIINYHQQIINHPNQSLWLLICVNLCQSVVYKPLASAAPSAHR